MSQSIFDRLRSMQTEGLPLHTLIVEACEVGNDLLAALEWAERCMSNLPGTYDGDLPDIRAAIAQAYRDDSNGNGGNGSNRSAA